MKGFHVLLEVYLNVTSFQLKCIKKKTVILWTFKTFNFQAMPPKQENGDFYIKVFHPPLDWFHFSQSYVDCGESGSEVLLGGFVDSSLNIYKWTQLWRIHAGGLQYRRMKRGLWVCCPLLFFSTLGTLLVRYNSILLISTFYVVSEYHNRNWEG